jgi:hypothetical protein
MRTLIFSLAALLLLPPPARAADEPAKARTADEIKKKLAEITARPAKEPEGLDGERAAALRRLKAYRYLARVPYDDLALDDEANETAQAATKLCAKLGRLDHRPDNPGLPEEEYKLGLKGTSRSNLGQGVPRLTLTESVDQWMYDSEEGNISRVGHRRWCLNPAMQKTGFGRSAGQFTAMYIFDRSRKEVPDYDFVGWPPPGPVPVEYFRGGAWTVSVNPAKYNKPGTDVTARLYAADKEGNKAGDALKLNYSGLDTGGFGIPNCIIFRPEKAAITPGRRYVVEIEGLTKGRDRKAAPLRYEVEFFSVK